MGLRSKFWSLANFSTTWLLSDSKSLEFTDAGRIHKSRAVARIFASAALIIAAVVAIFFGFIQDDNVKARQYVQREDNLGKIPRSQLLAGLDTGSYHCPCANTSIPYYPSVSVQWDNVGDILFDKQYWVCNRRAFNVINVSDIYCAQLFEDLTNTVRDSTFVSVELEGLTTIADTIQTQIKDAAASAKVAAVTAVLITIQFSGSTSDDVQAQVDELNTQFYPDEILPFVASITSANINASSSDAARGAASPNITVDWDQYYRACNPQYCEFTVGKSGYQWGLEIVALAWSIFNSAKALAVLAWATLVWLITKHFPSWGADSDLFDTLVVPTKHRWRFLAEDMRSHDVLRSPEFRIRGSIHTWRLRAHVVSKASYSSTLSMGMALQIVDFKPTPRNWEEQIECWLTVKNFKTNLSSVTRYAIQPITKAHFAKPGTGLVLVDDLEIGDTLAYGGGGTMGFLDHDGKLDIIFEAKATVQTLLM